jgi:hypothetical protein
MKKQPKVEYGITITKPWSKEMYDHNDAVADVVRETVGFMWIEAIREFAKEFDGNDEMLECEFSDASSELSRIQRAVTVYGFGFGYDVNRVAEIVVQDLEDAPYYRLKEIAEELDIKLEKSFIGLSK